MVDTRGIASERKASASLRRFLMLAAVSCTGSAQAPESRVADDLAWCGFVVDEVTRAPIDGVKVALWKNPDSDFRPLTEVRGTSDVNGRFCVPP